MAENDSIVTDHCINKHPKPLQEIYDELFDLVCGSRGIVFACKAAAASKEVDGRTTSEALQVAFEMLHDARELLSDNSSAFGFGELPNG